MHPKPAVSTFGGSFSSSSSNSREDSDEAIYVKTKTAPKPKATKVHANTSAKQSMGSESKLPQQQEYQDGEYESNVANDCKRSRMVTVLKTTGTRVSQLVQEYEQQHQAIANGHQLPTSLSGLCRVLVNGQPSASTRPATAGVPLQYHRSRMPSHRDPFPLVVVPPNQPYRCNSSTPIYNHRPTKPDPNLEGRPRYWECSMCRMRGIPYNFDVHMAGQLSCPTLECMHQFCRNCVVDSVGEVCEKMV
jgi:hypothetical protein